ncbi:MAG: CxxC-x17-CxxC domain-containing protein [Methanosarcina sp.]|jgi:CxxC-x17-CxxC domain-containing protein
MERKSFQGKGQGSSRGSDFSRGPQTMHKATCADCGVETEVPFKPDPDRPVYCRECYAKHKPKRY